MTHATQSFVIRRFNQLTLRQKFAHRRRLWQRRRNPVDGASWNVMGRHGTSWSVMERHGTSWNVVALAAAAQPGRRCVTERHGTPWRWQRRRNPVDGAPRALHCALLSSLRSLTLEAHHSYMTVHCSTVRHILSPNVARSREETQKKNPNGRTTDRPISSHMHARARCVTSHIAFHSIARSARHARSGLRI